MRRLIVTETVRMEFEIPDDFASTVEAAEEFFTNLESPGACAEQLYVDERTYAVREDDGKEIEIKKAESC